MYSGPDHLGLCKCPRWCQHDKEIAQWCTSQNVPYLQVTHGVMIFCASFSTLCESLHLSDLLRFVQLQTCLNSPNSTFTFNMLHDLASLWAFCCLSPTDSRKDVFCLSLFSAFFPLFQPLHTGTNSHSVFSNSWKMELLCLTHFSCKEQGVFSSDASSKVREVLCLISPRGSGTPGVHKAKCFF